MMLGSDLGFGPGSSATPESVLSVLRTDASNAKWTFSTVFLVDIADSSALKINGESPNATEDGGRAGENYVVLTYDTQPESGLPYAFAGGTLGGLSIATASGTVQMGLFGVSVYGGDHDLHWRFPGTQVPSGNLAAVAGLQVFSGGSWLSPTAVEWDGDYDSALKCTYANVMTSGLPYRTQANSVLFDGVGTLATGLTGTTEDA